MAVFILLLLILQTATANENYKKDSVLKHLHTGMKFAKDFLGSESVALKVADFVVRAFQTANSPSKQRTPSNKDTTHEKQSTDYVSDKRKFHNRTPSPMSPWRQLIKLMGLETNQVSAVAVNALIFVAQMITTFLAAPKGSKRQRHEDPIKWILNKNSTKLQELIAAAKSKTLPDLVSELIVGQDSKEETSCVSLLVCRIVPFVNKMQKVVFNEDLDNGFDRNVRGADMLHRYLPTRDEINKSGDICEKKFVDCNLYK